VSEDEIRAMIQAGIRIGEEIGKSELASRFIIKQILRELEISFGEKAEIVKKATINYYIEKGWIEKEDLENVRKTRDIQHWEDTER
jgi:hypothetical protein